MSGHLASSIGLSVNNYFEHGQTPHLLTLPFTELLNTKIKWGEISTITMFILGVTWRKEYDFMVTSVSFGIRLYGFDFNNYHVYFRCNMEKRVRFHGYECQLWNQIVWI